MEDDNLEMLKKVILEEDEPDKPDELICPACLRGDNPELKSIAMATIKIAESLLKITSELKEIRQSLTKEGRI